MRKPDLSNEGVKVTTLVSLLLHVGEAVMKLAGIYATVLEVIAEQVQNALDGNATRIEIEFNRRTNSYAVSDNGDGVDRQRFHQALQSVGKGIKTLDKLGRFGLGLISALGKCVYFTFTSCPAPHTKGYLEWILNTDDIKAQKTDVRIPMRLVPELRHESEKTKFRKNRTKVWWRTQIVVMGLTCDKTISRLSPESLAEEIVTKYSTAMARCGAKVVISFTDSEGNTSKTIVRAKDFRGKKLPEVRLRSDEGGEAVFRLFLTRPHQRGSSRVNLRFGNLGNDFRFSFANLARSQAKEILGDEVMAALRSGIFEGEILCENAELNPNRTCFNRDDALVGFCVSVEEWYQMHGKSHLDAQREERVGERYQQLGIKSMATLGQMLKDPDSAALLAVIKGFRKGTIGVGHVSHRGSLQDATSASVDGSETRTAEAEVEPRERLEKPEFEKKEHVPLTVQGPKGQRRRVVRNNSFGLQFAHDDLGGNHASRLWVLDCGEGVLTFNITHPLWAECDGSDAMVCALQENIVIQALTLETMPDPVWREHQRLFADEATIHFVSWLKSGVRFSKFGKKK